MTSSPPLLRRADRLLCAVRLLRAWCLLVALSWASAQEAAPPAPPPTVVPPAAPAPELPPLVYVPSDKISDNLLASGVVVPYADVGRLWDALGRHPSAPAPAAAMLSGLTLTGMLVDDTASITCTAEITALAEGWSQLALPPAMTLLSFAPSDPRMALERRGDQLTLHLPGAGHYLFTAAIAAKPSEDASGVRTLVLALPSAAVGSLDLLLPGQLAEVGLTPALAHTLMASGAQTRVHAVLGAGAEHLELSWHAPLEAVGQPVLLVGEQVRVQASERSLHEDVEAEIEVVRDRVAELAFQLPASLQLLAVDGPGLRTWEIAGGRLLVHLSQPVLGPLALRLSLEQPLAALPAGQRRDLELGVPALVGAERTTGTLVILSAGQEPLAIAIEDQAGFTRIDPSNLGQEGAVAALAFLAPPAPLALTMTRRAPELDATIDQLVRLGGDEDRIDLRCGLQVREAGIYGCSCDLPQDWELADVQAAGLAIESSRLEAAKAGLRRLQLSFANRFIGQGELRIQLRAPPSIPRGADGTIELGLWPAVRLREARSLRGTLALVAPRGWAIDASARTALAGEDAGAAAHEGPWAAQLSQLEADEVLALAFTWREDQADGGPAPQPSVRLQAAMRAREVEVRDEESVGVGDGDVHQVHDWRGEVRYSALPSLRLQAPSAWDAQLVIAGEGIADRAVVARDQGVTTWEVRFEQPVIGPFHLQVEHHQPLPPLVEGQELALSVPAVQVQGATRTEHVVAVSRIGALEVEARDDGLSELAPGDVPSALAGSGVVAAFQGAATGALNLRLARRDDLRLADAAVTRATYRAVLAPDGVLRVQCVVQLADRGRPTLELQLPLDAQLLELVVDGLQGHPVRQADGTIAVALPAVHGLSGVVLALVYQQPLQKAPLGWHGRLGIDLPQFGDAQHARPLPVEQVGLSLYLPDQLRSLAWRGDLAQREGLPDAASDGAEALSVQIAAIGTATAFERIGGGGTVQLWYCSVLAWWTAAVLAGVAGVLLALLLARRFAAGPGLLCLAGLTGLMASAALWSTAAALPPLALSAGALLVLLAHALGPWRLQRRSWSTTGSPVDDDPWLAGPAEVPASASPVVPGAESPASPASSASPPQEPPTPPTDPAPPAAPPPDGPGPGAGPT